MNLKKFLKHPIVRIFSRISDILFIAFIAYVLTSLLIGRYLPSELGTYISLIVSLSITIYEMVMDIFSLTRELEHGEENREAESRRENI